MANTDFGTKVTLQDCSSTDDKQLWRFQNDPATLREGQHLNWPHDDNAGLMIKPKANLSRALTLDNQGSSTWTYPEINRAVASTSQLWRVIPDLS